MEMTGSFEDSITSRYLPPQNMLFRISQKNVSFKLTSPDGETYQYTAPSVPSKHNVMPGWRDIPPEEEREHLKVYTMQLKEYKDKLRPDRIRPPSSLPESIRPCYIAVGNPSLY